MLNTNKQNFLKIRKNHSTPIFGTNGITVHIWVTARFEDDVMNHVENFCEKLKILLITKFQKFIKKSEQIVGPPFLAYRELLSISGSLPSLKLIS